MISGGVQLLPEPYQLKIYVQIEASQMQWKCAQNEARPITETNIAGRKTSEATVSNVNS